MKIIDKSADFINKGKVEIIGSNPTQITVQVDDKLVILRKKAGRILDSCSCQNHSRFCVENPRCSHKLAAETYLVMRRIKWK